MLKRFNNLPVFLKVFIIALITILPVYIFEGLYRSFIQDYFTGKDVCTYSSYPSDHICSRVSSVHRIVLLIIWFIGVIFLRSYLKKLKAKRVDITIFIGTFIGAILTGWVFFVALLTVANSPSAGMVSFFSVLILPLLMYPLTISVLNKLLK